MRAGLAWRSDYGSDKNLLLIWRLFRHFHAALADLGSRSVRELAEWGIARADIVGVAYATAERSVAAAPSRRAVPAVQDAELVPAR